MKDHVRPYKPEDYEQVAHWFHKRSMPIPLAKDLPPIGFIADFFAAGFLYIADGNFGIIDCYISNPESKKNLRSIVLDEITERLIRAAGALGCSRVKCDTQNEMVAFRAKSHGFKELGYFKSFVKEI